MYIHSMYDQLNLIWFFVNNWKIFLNVLTAALYLTQQIKQKIK